MNTAWVAIVRGDDAVAVPARAAITCQGSSVDRRRERDLRCAPWRRGTADADSARGGRLQEPVGVQRGVRSLHLHRRSERDGQVEHLRRDPLPVPAGGPLADGGCATCSQQRWARRGSTRVVLDRWHRDRGAGALRGRDDRAARGKGRLRPRRARDDYPASLRAGAPVRAAHRLGEPRASGVAPRIARAHQRRRGGTASRVRAQRGRFPEGGRPR